VQIGRELARLERLHAAMSAIRAVEQAGGTAHYHSVDLTDADGVTAAMERVGATSGRIDVLLHAGGLEISHALPDKPAEQFALVFDVKADGWFNVLHGAGDLPIGATVCFSSIAGRFGNAGQTDYAAANDLLSKTTSSFRRTRPETRGLVLDWTAWGGIGMATRGSIPKVMEMAGIDMLPPEAGIPWIRRELTSTDHAGEVVVAGSLGVMEHPFHPTGGLDVDELVVRTPGPMVGRVVGAGGDGSVVVEVDLDPSVQGFLDDHRIDGTPVLPGVMGIEAFAEAARVVAPDLHVVAVEDVTFATPFKFYRDETRTVRVRVVVRRDAGGVVADCRLEGERALATAEDVMITTHFTGRVRLSEEPVRPVAGPVPAGPTDGSLEADDLYAVYFHGPTYQVVERAWRDGDSDRCVGAFARDLPPNHAGGAPTVLAPRLLELCFQTAGIWEIATTGRMALPEHVDRVEVFGAEETDLVAVASPTDVGADIVVVDGSGDVRVRMIGYRTVALPVPLAEDLRAPLAVVAG
jgi:hypothetical protein